MDVTPDDLLREIGRLYMQSMQRDRIIAELSQALRRLEAKNAELEATAGNPDAVSD